MASTSQLLASHPETRKLGRIYPGRTRLALREKVILGDRFQMNLWESSETQKSNQSTQVPRQAET